VEFLREHDTRPECGLESRADCHGEKVRLESLHLRLQIIENDRQILYVFSLREIRDHAAPRTVDLDLGGDEILHDAEAGRV